MPDQSPPRTSRRPDTGMKKPYRPAPADFRETYIRLGWDSIREHYRTNDRCIARWIEECGGDELRRERLQVTGVALRPDIRSDRYRGAGDRVGSPDHDGQPHLPTSGTWLRAFGGAYRLLLALPQINELQDRCAHADRHGSRHSKAFYAIHGALCGGWNDIEDRPFPAATSQVPTATFAECIEAIRLALIGGGMAVVDGRLVDVDAAHADRVLKKHLVDAPLEHARRLASVILAWTIMGPPKPALATTGGIS